MKKMVSVVEEAKARIPNEINKPLKTHENPILKPKSATKPQIQTQSKTESEVQFKPQIQTAINTQGNNIYITENDPLETNEINSGFDKNSIKLFNQTYERKLKIVVEPAFKKYENTLKQRGLDVTVNAYTGTRSMFCATSGVLSASLTLDYDGIEHVTVKAIILDGEQKRVSESVSLDFTSLDNQKMISLLNGLCDKFTKILITKRLVIAD